MSSPHARLSLLALSRLASRRWLLVLGIVASFAGLGATPSPGSTVGPSSTAGPNPTPRFDLASVPMLAYYYIWYDASSWTRAKSDQPLLGPYSSDDEAVMRQHIAWAKAAGIDGFIVSWKSTAVLDRRLDSLVRIARELDFKLAIIYQGLDFSRDPLPAAQVAEDLDYFMARYASNPVFDIFGKPLVIWSGTWKFSPADIEHVTASRRDRLLILASERSLDGVARLADLVDGNAYYWSSVNPDTTPDHETKLVEMSTAVHDAGGLWIAPAAPGFDARLVGGTTVVDRQDGKTLQKQLDAAIHSLPDAIGLISWNEFSENSDVEPSKVNGDTSLKVLAELRKTNLTSIGDFDSSSPEGLDQSAGVGRFLAIGIIAVLGLLGIVVTARRRRRKRT
jgi:Glycosyl hydrolase family 71.